MQVHMVLALISYLLGPSGASILGCCVVAKKLRDGGLDDFEGYSLQNCKYGPLSPFTLPSALSILTPTTTPPHTSHLLHHIGVCLAYFESKFNPSAAYENTQCGYTGFGLFQIRDSGWCGHSKNLCKLSCSGGAPPLSPWGTSGCRASLW